MGGSLVALSITFAMAVVVLPDDLAPLTNLQMLALGGIGKQFHALLFTQS